jgi:uncharacterized protein YndB with AHSA1/START domain
MTATFTLPPVRKSVRVAVTPPRAFELFTSGMHGWWPQAHSLLKSARHAIIIEPHPGGRWYERAVDDSECTWGKVLVWDPPRRAVLGWQLDGTWTYDPDFLTEVEIRFIPEGDAATRVELEHRNIERYGDQAAKTRESLDSAEGWQLGLAQYAEYVEKA